MTVPKIYLLSPLQRGNIHSIIYSEAVAEFTLERKLKVVLDVARGMSYLHSFEPPIIHRDLKPANILIDENWVAKIADLGLATMGNKSLTLSLKGTPYYISPEILLRGACGKESDVYSYGITICEIFSEEEPFTDFKDDPIVGFCFKITHERIRPKLPINVDTPIIILIEDCINFDPERRPPFTIIEETLIAISKNITV